MTSKLVMGEALRLFYQKAQDRGTETNANSELLMKDLISNLFPPKSLCRQKRYLIRGLYKYRNTKIRDFVCSIDETVDSLKKFLHFGAGKCLPED